MSVGDILSRIVSRGATGAAIGSSGGPGIGTAIGGVAGGLEGFLESLFTGGGDDDARKYIEGLKFSDPRDDPSYSGALDKLKSYSTGQVLPEDRAREAHALDQAQQFAQGQTGAIQARSQAQGGGNLGMASALENQAGQGAASRLSAADTDTASMASQRGAMASQELMRQLSSLTQMQNQFAAMKAGKMADIASSEQLARQQNIDSAVGAAGNLAGIFAKGSAPAPTPHGPMTGNMESQSGEAPNFAGTITGAAPGFLSTLSRDPAPGAITAAQAAQNLNARSAPDLEGNYDESRKALKPSFTSFSP